MALIDMDFRTPDQIQASQLEAIAPYVQVSTNSVKAVTPKVVEKSTSWWTSVVTWFGSLAEMRLRVLPIEWSR